MSFKLSSRGETKSLAHVSVSTFYLTFGMPTFELGHSQILFMKTVIKTVKTHMLSLLLITS